MKKPIVLTILSILLGGCTSTPPASPSEALIAEAQSLVNKEQFAPANSRLNELEVLAKQSHDSRTLGAVHFLRSSIAKQERRFDDAISELNLSISYRQKASDYIGEAASRAELVPLYAHKANYHAALYQIRLAREAYAKGRVSQPDRHIPIYNPQAKDFPDLLDQMEQAVKAKQRS